MTTTGAQKGGFEMKLYNIIHNENLATIKGHFGTVHSVAFHPDGMSFASGAEDGYVHYHRFLPDYYTKKFEWRTYSTSNGFENNLILFFN